MIKYTPWLFSSLCAPPAPARKVWLLERFAYADMMIVHVGLQYSHFL
jgi:hypothetical protein